MLRPRRQTIFRARHRRPICSGWNRHSLRGPNQRSSRGRKVCLLGAAARLRRGACFIAQTYPSATNVFSPTPDGKTLSGGLQPARRRNPSVPRLRQRLREGSGRPDAAMCAAMAPAMLLRIQLCAYLVSPAPQPTFIPWGRRWQPILPVHDLCWRSIIAVTASPNTIAIPKTTRFESHSPTYRQCWRPSRSLRPYLSARLLVAYLRSCWPYRRRSQSRVLS